MNVPSRQIDRKTFLANVRQSGLIAPATVATIEKALPAESGGRATARYLLERGLLTRFQAERLLAGRTAGFLLGQYKILDQLGRGGMGRVFKAEHRTMGRIVALKVLSPGLVDTDRAQDLFLREVRAAARLVHPNIVTAYDANELNGRYFLVLEYVDGPNLDQLVKAQGALPVGLACDYIRQAALGLQCAHLQGMVHRDIKPANILVQRRGADDNVPGVVKISDFGLARLHAPDAVPVNASQHAGTILTRDNTVMGTPDYLSPEQARCLHKTDIRSDIYSLGCTFYFLLTGQVPHPGGNSLEKLIRHTTESPKPVSKFRTDVPPEIVAILDKMLARHPSQRYQTPADLAAALEPFAVSGAIPWAPPPAPYLDDTETPVEVMPDSDAELVSSDAMSALVNTAPRERAPTPKDVLFSGVVRRPVVPPRKKRRKSRAWLGWVALLMILSGLAGGGWLVYLNWFAVK
jgi:serine/threonine-protein kinase